MAFFDEDLPMVLVKDPETGRLLQRVEFSVPPLGKVAFSSPGQGGPVRSGYGVVTSERRLAGMVRFHVSGIGTAGVTAGQKVSRIILPVKWKSKGVSTGVAIANPEWGPVPIVMKLFDAYGRAVPGVELYYPLEARTAESRYIFDWFRHLELELSDFEGTLTLEVDCSDDAVYSGIPCEKLPGESFVVLGLEMGTGGEGITTVPITVLEE
jgi:hypothetical protein